MICDTRLTLE